MAMLDRRTFLIRSAGAAAGSVLGSNLMAGLVARQARALAATCDTQAGPGEGGYGALQPAGPELALPAGFTYVKLGMMGAPMSDLRPTPSAHDGMAAFPMRNGNIRLIRNHEIPGFSTPILPSPPIDVDLLRGYDLGGQGGTTSLEVQVMPDGQRRLVREFVSLSGTIANCAGGRTPWGTWISCEETTFGGPPLRKPHGYCFEVPSWANEQVRARPLKAMGRFVHEAVAVDPRTWIVYETEDRTNAGFYRFIPRLPGLLLAGGRLQMLAIEGQPNYDASVGQQVGEVLPVAWVDIDDPDPDDAEANDAAVSQQGFAQGAARFRRLEGCWSGNRRIFFTSTNGGDAGVGQVWEYQPVGRARGRLRLLYESATADCLDGPDNITVSPRGGILMCEDGGGDQYLRGLTPEGKIFDFAQNIFRPLPPPLPLPPGAPREFAGATFSPDGETLFVNIQGDVPNEAMTFAIWGPWENGAL